MKNWEDLKNRSFDEYVKAYKNFMYNRSNEFCCTECPENSGHTGRLPCGQQNCWVTCHCAN